MSLREGTGTSRSAAQQWHAARGMQNLAKQPKDDHATSLGQNRSAPCIRGRQCAPRRSGAAIRQHRGGIPLGSRSKCGVRPRAASAMVPRGGHRLNEPVVGEVGGRGGRGPDPLHPETPPFSKRVFSLPPESGYADDLTIVTGSVTEAQAIITACAHFADWSGLQLNPGKCQASAYREILFIAKMQLASTSSPPSPIQV